MIGSGSPLVACRFVFRSVPGLLSEGGPMGGGAEGVASIGSLAADSAEEEGRIGMDL